MPYARCGACCPCQALCARDVLDCCLSGARTDACARHLWQAFVVAHGTAAQARQRMLAQLGRAPHIAPAVFLEAVRSYRHTPSCMAS